MDESFDLSLHWLKGKLRWVLQKSSLLPYVRPYKSWTRPVRRLLQRAWPAGLGALCKGGARIVACFTQLALAFWFLVHVQWLRWHGLARIPKAAPRKESSRIVMLVVSYLPVDPRVEREARALAVNGFLVTVICPMWATGAPIPDWGAGIEFRILPERAGRFAGRFPYVLGKEMYRAAMAEEAWAYHSHDLNTALVALAAAAAKGVPCLCDFHEWFSENVTFDATSLSYSRHDWLTRWVFRQVEAMALRHASAVVTVCESIGQSLEKEFDSPQRVHIIRNIPPPEQTQPDEQCEPIDLHALLGIPKQKKILLYQGGIDPSRNLGPIIQAMAYVDSAVFVIRGPMIEHHAPNYLRLAKECGSAGNVFCLAPVASREVVREARSADMGAWTLLSNVGLNFKLALPNKVFEYLAAGIPILAADLPEVRKLIDTFQVGLCFDPEDPCDIARTVRIMAEDDGFRRRCRENTSTALNALDATREWQKLVTIYQGMQRLPIVTGELCECAV